MQYNQAVAGFLNVFDFESITVSTTAIALTAAKVKGNPPDDDGSAKGAFISCEGNVVRYRLDGTDPTASVGHELAVGGTLQLANYQQIVDVRFIRRDSSDGTLRVSYQR